MWSEFSSNLSPDLQDWWKNVVNLIDAIKVLFNSDVDCFLCSTVRYMPKRKTKLLGNGLRKTYATYSFWLFTQIFSAKALPLRLRRKWTSGFVHSHRKTLHLT